MLQSLIKVSEYHFRDDASAISGETRKKGFFRSGKIKRAITGLTKKKDRSSAASSISGASRVSSAHSLRSRNSYVSNFEQYKIYLFYIRYLKKLLNMF